MWILKLSSDRVSNRRTAQSESLPSNSFRVGVSCLCESSEPWHWHHPAVSHSDSCIIKFQLFKISTCIIESSYLTRRLTASESAAASEAQSPARPGADGHAGS